MTRLVLASGLALIVSLFSAGSAQAQHFGHGHQHGGGGYYSGSFYRGGYSIPSYGYGSSYYGGYQRPHVDYMPGGFQQHFNHFHYQPGHYDLHMGNRSYQMNPYNGWVSPFHHHH